MRPPSVCSVGGHSGSLAGGPLKQAQMGGRDGGSALKTLTGPLRHLLPAPRPLSCFSFRPKLCHRLRRSLCLLSGSHCLRGLASLPTAGPTADSPYTGALVSTASCHARLSLQPGLAVLRAASGPRLVSFPPEHLELAFPTRGPIRAGSRKPSRGPRIDGTLSAAVRPTVLLGTSVWGRRPG